VYLVCVSVGAAACNQPGVADQAVKHQAHHRDEEQAHERGGAVVATYLDSQTSEQHKCIKHKLDKKPWILILAPLDLDVEHHSLALLGTVT